MLSALLYEMRRHDTYCGNSDCSPETLLAGLRPGARRARGLPSNRSRTVTTQLCQAVAHFLRLGGDPQSPDLESSIATQQNAACDQAPHGPAIGLPRRIQDQVHVVWHQAVIPHFHVRFAPEMNADIRRRVVSSIDALADAICAVICWRSIICV
jgi:hypothetical protein